MAYTTIDKPSDYFNTKLYTGTGGTQAITGVGFQPDWVWLKARSSAYSHQLFDVVRGATKLLSSEETSAEQTLSGVTAFGSDGFTVGSDAGSNNNTTTFASWNWKAGGSASSNTDGSITSTVSANTTSGFSIVSYTGNGTDGATVGHGLTSPKLVLIKDRDNATPWLMYGYPNHPAFPNDGSLIKLNENSAMVTDDSTTELSIGSSTVTFVDAGSAINANSTQFIMYCFQEKKGFSKFGSYVGNGSTNGSYIHLGFSPAFVMVKRTDSTSNWGMYDSGRDVDNVVTYGINANTTAADDTSDFMDFLSNGFKHRSTSVNRNGSGATYIFMAFAESPIVSSNGVPAVAR